MRKELLIVGIDPGITTAYAILDLKGNLLKLKSSKMLTLQKIIQEVIPVGRVIVVGTDVRYSPHYVDKFVSKLGARLIHPEKDIPVGEKTRVTKEFKTQDAHQRDALTAALLAWRTVQQTVEKVRETLKKEAKEHLFDEIVERVLKGTSIVDAICQSEAKPEVQHQKKRIREKIKRSFRLVEENRLLQKRTTLLNEELERMKRKIEEVEKNIYSIAEERIKKATKIKEEKIHALHREVERKEREKKELQNEVRKWELFVHAAKEKRVVKKFKNLGQEVIAHIEKGDILYVEDMNAYSEKTWEHLKDKVTTIIYKQKPSNEIQTRSYNFINRANIKMIEQGSLALVDEKELEREKKKSDSLYKIIEEYKEKRGN